MYGLNALFLHLSAATAIYINFDAVFDIRTRILPNPVAS
jgi:hypothetical protein